MKRAALFTFTLFLVAIIYSSCKEDEYMDWKIINNQWLEKLKAENTDTNFHVTSSGLCYRVLYQGWKYDRHPNVNSYLYVQYKGTLIDGSVFQQDTTGISLSTAIAGWKEGIPKMNDGGHYIFYIPYKLGYDTATTNSNIPPYSTLIFDVKLEQSIN